MWVCHHKLKWRKLCILYCWSCLNRRVADVAKHGESWHQNCNVPVSPCWACQHCGKYQKCQTATWEQKNSAFQEHTSSFVNMRSHDNRAQRDREREKQEEWALSSLRKKGGNKKTSSFLKGCGWFYLIWDKLTTKVEVCVRQMVETLTLRSIVFFFSQQ